MPKRSAEFGRLRQICCLGLPSQIVIPQVLEELHGLISAARMHFAWSDRLGNIVNGYFEKPDAQALDYFKDHSQQFQDEAGLSYRHTLLFGKPTGNFRWPFKPGFENTESHRALFGNLGLEHCIDGVVRDPYGPLGQIFLLRRRGEPEFSASDEETLGQALPYLAHALSAKGTNASSFVETGDSALMVFAADGRLTFRSDRAKELSFYALAQPEIGADWQAGLAIRQTQAAIDELFVAVRRAIATYRAGGAPPAWTISNAWGQFQVRAYELHTDGDAAVSYGVLLEKKMPVEVRLLQRIKALPLSNRQREVCYLLARGVAIADIAGMLSISTPTLKEHTQVLYRKLDVRNRDELARFVLGDSA
jgi:DNA-binding CsgD family transcriptional regulator